MFVHKKLDEAKQLLPSVVGFCPGLLEGFLDGIEWKGRLGLGWGDNIELKDRNQDLQELDEEDVRSLSRNMFFGNVERNIH